MADFVGPDASMPILRSRVHGEQADRFQLLGDGTILKGDGSGSLSAESINDVIWPLKKFGSLAGTDHTAVLQAAANAAAELAASSKGGATIICPPGTTLYSNGIKVAGTVAFDLQGGVLRSTADDNTKPLFANDPTGGVTFGLRNGEIRTNNRVTELKMNGGVASGIIARIANLNVVSASAVHNATDYFYFNQADFLSMRDIVAYYADRSIVVESNFNNGEHDNTQLHFDNIALLYNRLGVYLRQCDKVTLRGVDIARCGSGFHLFRDNKRVSLLACHVERFGDSTLTYAPGDGIAYWVTNNGSSEYAITHERCSTLLPETNAAASYQVDDAPASNPASAVYRECHAARDTAKTAYRPLKFGGQVVWDGPWPYTVDDAGNSELQAYVASVSTATWTDIVVCPQRGAPPVSRNLLPFSRISRPEDLPNSNGAGTLAVAADPGGIVPNGRQLTLSGGAVQRWANVTLQKGWHTLIWHGYTTGSDFFMWAALGSGAFTDRVYKRFQGDQEQGYLYRIPFYVPASATHRVGVRCLGAGGAAIVGRIELHRGFVDDFSDEPTVSSASAAPTTGVYGVGDRVKNSAPAASGPPGWVCVTAPNTFKAEANLAA